MFEDLYNPAVPTRHLQVDWEATEQPYWLCCGCTDPRHDPACMEAKMGHPERCRFGTLTEHRNACQT
jgi:hypothetical protein